MASYLFGTKSIPERISVYCCPDYQVDAAAKIDVISMQICSMLPQQIHLNGYGHQMKYLPEY